MHIAIYSDDPGHGGVAQYNHSIAKGFRAEGHEVTCIQARMPSPMVEEREKLGIHHCWLSSDAKDDFIRSITDQVEPERILRELSPDLVVFSDCCPLSNIAARHVAISRNIPFIIVVGFVGEYLATRFKSCLGVLSRQYDFARQVVAVSNENLSLLRRYFGLKASKGVVIHYGRPEAFFGPPDRLVRESVRGQWAVPNDAIVCFTAARLTPLKGLQHVLQAAYLLKSHELWSRLYFVLAGDGELKGHIQEELKKGGMEDHFRLLGQRWDVPRLLEGADLFLLPSHLEGMPLTIMEAMARRVPVIASAVSGIPEEIADTGILISNPAIYPEKAVRELVTGIMLLAGDDKLRQEKCIAARLRAEMLFTESRMIADLKALYMHHVQSMAR